MPSQKLGRDSPASAARDAAASAARPRRVAATTPAGRAISRDASSAAPASCSVGTSAVPTMPSTGRPVWMDRPRSPVTAWPSQDRNRSGSGWSSA